MSHFVSSPLLTSLMSGTKTWGESREWDNMKTHILLICFSSLRCPAVTWHIRMYILLSFYKDWMEEAAAAVFVCVFHCFTVCDVKAGMLVLVSPFSITTWPSAPAQLKILSFLVWASYSRPTVPYPHPLLHPVQRCWAEVSPRWGGEELPRLGSSWSEKTWPRYVC